MSAPYIDNRAERRKVIGSHDSGSDLRGECRHGCVEDRCFFGMLYQVRKEFHSKEMVKGSFPRLHAVQKAAPCLLVQRPRVLERNGAE